MKFWATKHAKAQLCGKVRLSILPTIQGPLCIASRNCVQSTIYKRVSEGDEINKLGLVIPLSKVLKYGYRYKDLTNRLGVYFVFNGTTVPKEACT